MGDAAGSLGRHGAFLLASAGSARGDRVRGSNRLPDGAAAPAVQSRPARRQRAQHHARHSERGAGPAPPGRATPARMSSRVAYLDDAATPTVAPELAARIWECLPAQD